MQPLQTFSANKSVEKSEARYRPFFLTRPCVWFGNALNDWSGRGESNPRHSAWEADVLPLNYARDRVTHTWSLVGAQVGVEVARRWL